MKNFSEELKKKKINEVKLTELKKIRGGDSACQKCGFSGFIRNIIDMLN